MGEVGSSTTRIFGCRPSRFEAWNLGLSQLLSQLFKRMRYKCDASKDVPRNLCNEQG